MRRRRRWYEQVTAVHDVVRTLQDEEHTEAWHKTLAAIADQKGLHGLLVGLCVRLLLNVGVFDREETAVRMERALSVRLMSGREIEQLTQTAAWLEGFLKGSGLLVLHDQTLWQLLDEWLNQLEGDRFQDILPLLRRTFADFPETIRQQILERVKLGMTGRDGGETAVVEFDYERADTVLPLVAQFLGLERKMTGCRGGTTRNGRGRSKLPGLRVVSPGTGRNFGRDDRETRPSV